MTTSRALLLGLVGPVGVEALAKASARIPGLEGACLPRALHAWLSLAALHGYEGPIPGIDASISLTKAEGTYSGVIEAGKQSYSYRDVDLVHVAAAVGALVGAQPVPAAEAGPPVV